MFIFKGFILYLVYLFIYSNFINIILNATGIFALKKADNLTWSITFNFAFFFFFVLFVGMISLVNFEFEVYKEFYSCSKVKTIWIAWIWKSLCFFFPLHITCITVN